MVKTHKASETDGTDAKGAPPATNQAATESGPGRAAAGKGGPARKAPAVAAPGGRKSAVKASDGAAKPSGPPAKAVAEHTRKSPGAKAAAPTASRGDAPAGADGQSERGELGAGFLAEQRRLLEAERRGYVRQAEELKAEADSLALEHEPGDVQFDEEGGEGGTSNVDRELDLVLSAQARSAILEIDRALAKIDAGSYGRCEQCGRPIPEARLQALPYAALCVSCKSGGLSRR
jgi:DnaK suppressor protein